jgi:hypothetical protein
MINPDLRYTPAPDCPPSRMIPAVAIQVLAPSLSSTLSEAIGGKTDIARQRVNTLMLAITDQVRPTRSGGLNGSCRLVSTNCPLRSRAKRCLRRNA